MIAFYRSSFTAMFLRLTSNEELGILDSDYLEDYFGNDGQISLYHVATDTRYPVVMTELPAETPAIDHDVFQGMITLTSIPDGLYQLQCRVRDTGGNYRIIGAVQSPIGGEDVSTIELDIRSGESQVYVMAESVLTVRAVLSDLVNCARPVLGGSVPIPFTLRQAT